MLNFNLNDLRQWKPVAIGEVLDFAMPSAGFRAVHFDVMASGTVAVQVVTGGEEYWLVGYGQGEMAIKFALDEPFGLVFMGDPATDVYMRSQLDAPIIPESEEASYTTIEPRPAGPSDDLRRMMNFVKINEARRQAQLEADRLRQQQEHEATLQALQAGQQPAPAPAPAPVPANEPVVE